MLITERLIKGNREKALGDFGWTGCIKHWHQVHKQVNRLLGCVAQGVTCNLREMLPNLYLASVETTSGVVCAILVSFKDCSDVDVAILVGMCEQ